MASKTKVKAKAKAKAKAKNNIELNWERDYKEHRERLKAATCTIDHSAPAVHTANYVRFGKIKDDGDTFIRNAQQNLVMLTMLGTVLKTRGAINTFRDEKIPLAANHLNGVRIELRRIEFENQKLGKRLLAAEPEIDTWNRELILRNKKVVEPPQPFRIPKEILEKYGMSIDSFLQLPQDVLRKLLRPIIYLDIEASGHRTMGRLVIELYTEAAPQVVIEFVRACHTHKASLFNIRRIFPELWLAGELTIKRKTICTKRLEFDMRCIDNQAGPGILSLARSDLNGFKHGVVAFSISFKPLRIANGRRVAFGRVVAGLKVLHSIEEIGTKYGKLSEPIRVAGCSIKL